MKVNKSTNKIALTSLLLCSMSVSADWKSYTACSAITAAAMSGGYLLYTRHQNLNLEQQNLEAQDKQLIETIKDNVERNENIADQTINALDAMIMLRDASLAQKEGLKSLARQHNTRHASNPGQTLITDLEQKYADKINAISSSKWRPAVIGAKATAGAIAVGAVVAIGAFALASVPLWTQLFNAVTLGHFTGKR
jgi:hypothetical protein